MQYELDVALVQEREVQDIVPSLSKQLVSVCRIVDSYDLRMHGCMERFTADVTVILDVSL